MLSETIFTPNFSEEYPNGKQLFGPGKPLGAAGVSGAAAVALQLTSAQLLALQTTAVQLVGAPTLGGGYQLYPSSLYAEYVFGGTAYTIGNADNAFQIEYTGKTTALLSMLVTGLVDQAASTTACNQVTTPGAKIAKANCNILGLEVKLIGTTAALTLGNGTVNIVLGYDIVTLF